MMKCLLKIMLIMALLSGVEAQAATQALVPKTGQTTSYAAGDDGALSPGVALPVPRFTNNGTGAITDNLTGLIWLQNANCTDTVGGVAKASGYLTWANALTWSNSLASGSCGLSDGSAAGDWRLPNVEELESLVDLQRTNPALPTVNPFSAVQSSWYWSSTTYASSTGSAWYVYVGNGGVVGNGKANFYYVWPVRGGQSGAFASLSLSPGTKDFGSITTNSSSSVQTFTLSNSGSANLLVSAMAVTGSDSGMFTLTSGDGTAGSCGATPTIAPAGSCTVTATFTPTSVGAKAATLRIASNDPATPKDIALTGTGMLPTYTIGTSVVGGHGTIACDSPVNQGASSNCTVTADGGYHLFTFTDNSADKLTSVVANAYSIVNVTADHVIAGSFAGNDAAATIGAPTTSAITTSGATITNTITDADGVQSVAYFIYSDAAGTTQIATNATGSFTGLSSGNNYWAKTTAQTKNATTNIWSNQTSSLTAFTTLTVDAAATIGAPTTSAITTSGATITNTITDADGVQSVVYFLYSDAAGTAQVATNATGSFTGLSSGTNYWAKTTAQTKNATTNSWSNQTSALVAFTTTSIHTVRFTSNGGSSVISQSVDNNITATTPVEPTKTGYTFAGWYSDSNRTSVFAFTTIITADTTLYAKWTLNSYALNFAAGANGTLTGTASQTVNYSGNASQVTAVPITGYHFDNWSGTSGFVTSTTNPLTVSNIATAQNITANFAKSDGVIIPAVGKTQPDISDALRVLQIVTGNVTPTANDLARADIAPLGGNGTPKGDGVVDIYDVIAILRMTVGLL